MLWKFEVQKCTLFSPDLPKCKLHYIGLGKHTLLARLSVLHFQVFFILRHGCGEGEPRGEKLGGGEKPG